MAKYKGPTAGDLIIHEESQAYCREGIVVTNQTAAAVTALVGHPIDASGNIVLAGGEATTVGLLTEEVPLEASGSSTLKAGYIARGPCVINEDKIAATDTAGAGYNLAGIKTALEALNFVFRAEPTKSSVQVN